MPVRPVLTYPHPFLKTKCEEADVTAPDLQDRLGDLRDTMEAHPGCVGLAAPQIGWMVRAMVVDTSRSRRANENHGFLCLVNPAVLEATQWKVSREGCLSFPNLLANVKRAQKLRLKALDEKGATVEITAVGFEAVALQHELDHLDGIVFLDRVRSTKDLIERQA